MIFLLNLVDSCQNNRYLEKVYLGALAGRRSSTFEVLFGWDIQEEAKQEKLQRTLILKLKKTLL